MNLYSIYSMTQESPTHSLWLMAYPSMFIMSHIAVDIVPHFPLIYSVGRVCWFADWPSWIFILSKIHTVYCGRDSKRGTISLSSPNGVSHITTMAFFLPAFLAHFLYPVMLLGPHPHPANVLPSFLHNACHVSWGIMSTLPFVVPCVQAGFRASQPPSVQLPSNRE